MNYRTAAALIALASSLAACATVTRGTNTRMVVISEPPGAEVHTNNGFNCQSTPCNFRMSRKDSFDVTISKPGYETQTVHVRSKASTTGVVAMTAGNFLIGGVIGAGVDAASGATNDLDPNPVHVTLVPKAGTQTSTAAAPTAAQ